MGTEIISYEDLEDLTYDGNINILLKRFYGGKDRGTCYSITFRNSAKDYIEITEDEFMYLIYKRLRQDYDEIQNKDTLYDGHIRYIKAIKPLMDYLEKKNNWK